MSNIKISEMTEASSLGDSDLLTIVQGGVNKKITKSNAIGDIITALNNPTYITGTGTALTLNNTRVGRIKSTLYGDTEQETTTGKQLFNINETHTDTNCTSSVVGDKLMQNNSTNWCRTIWKIENLSVGTSYTMYAEFNNPNSSTINIRVMDSTDTSVISQTNSTTDTSGSQTLTFTATTTTHYFRFYSNSTATNNTHVVTFSKIMLNQGSTTQTYESYTGRNTKSQSNISTKC